MMSAKQLFFLVLIVAVVGLVSAKHGSKSNSANTKTISALKGEPQVTTRQQCDGAVRYRCINGEQEVISYCTGKESGGFCHRGTYFHIKKCSCFRGKRWEIERCFSEGENGCVSGYTKVEKDCEDDVETGGWDGCENIIKSECIDNERIVFSSCPEDGVDDCFDFGKYAIEKC